MGKKYKAGITEKRLQNRRFRRTEEAILRVFFKEDIYIGTKEMAMRAGVARSTFYHHHRTVREILPDYERYILKKYAEAVGGMMRRKGVNFRAVYGRTLVFILQNRMVFGILMRNSNVGILREMLEKVRPEVIKYMKLVRNSEKVFKVYAGEIMELMRGWSEMEFREEEMRRVLDDIMYLTDTARVRLSPIA